MNIGLFGGSFDPIHNGHLSVAQHILDSNIVDEVWFMPSYISLYQKKLSAPGHRVKMIELATQNNPKMKVFDYEIKNCLETDTYSNTKKIMSEYKNDTFSIIIGQDNANQIAMWGHCNEIVQEMKFIVIPRPGYPIFDNPWYYKEPHVFLPDAAKDYPISSTIIRKQIKNHANDIELPLSVIQYIYQYELYIPSYLKKYR